MYYMIAVSDIGIGERIIRLYNTENQAIVEKLESEVIEGITNMGLHIENLGINEDNKLVGTQGAIGRYAHSSPGLERRRAYPIVVLYKNNRGFKVLDCDGQLTTMSEEELILYNELYGLANAKVVTKGKTRFISAISGTFELIGGSLSDDLIDQWKRILTLRADGKLSDETSTRVDGLNDEFMERIKKLKRSELRNKAGTVFNLVRMHGVILDIAEILDEVDSDRVEDMQNKVSKLYKKVRASIRHKNKSIDKDKKDKLKEASKFIGDELKKTIKYVEEERISSDECLRRFSVIEKLILRLEERIDNA